MTNPDDHPGLTRRDVIVAGHRGSTSTAMAALDSDQPDVRDAALGALERIGSLTDEVLRTALRDPDVTVRRRAAELAAGHLDLDLFEVLFDVDDRVIEVAAWACGEHEVVTDATLERLIELATDATDPLIRESSAAALGAIGDPRGLPAILAACSDKPAVRRRAVLALAPFLGDPASEDAVERALNDRDWQVRQAAEDLRRATRGNLS